MLYDELAGWWPLLSAPADYAGEADTYRALLVEACAPRTLLELGSGGHDAGGRSLRYLEWTHPPEPGSTTFRVDFAFLLREEDGDVRAVHDRHEMGLFPRQTWLDLSREAGFLPEVRGVVHPGPEPAPAELLLCRRPPEGAQ